MTPKPKGIAARAGHWSARHRKTAIFGWLAAIVIIFMVGQSLGQIEPKDSQSLNGESRTAAEILDTAGFPDKSGEMVLVQSKTAKANDPAFKAALADVTKTVSEQKIVTNVVKPQISKDKHSALVQFDLTGDPETAEERVGPVLDATAGVAKRHAKLDIEQYGDASMMKILGEKQAEEEGRSMMLTLISTLIILLHRLRRARRRLGAADPRRHRRVRHGRPRRHRQPADADGPHRPGRDHADRPRGRRRLLAVLHPPRA